MSELLTADQWAALGSLFFLAAIGATLWLLFDLFTGGERP